MNGIFSALTEGDLKRIASVALLILFNFVFAVVGAIMRGGFDPSAGGFDFKKLPTFFYSQVLPYVVGFAFFEAFLHLHTPGEMTTALFGATPDIDLATIEEPSTFWDWLNPTTLWATYSAIVLSLAKKTWENMVYMFGKGLVLAQSLASK